MLFLDLQHFGLVWALDEGHEAPLAELDCLRHLFTFGHIRYYYLRIVWLVAIVSQQWVVKSELLAYQTRCNVVLLLYLVAIRIIIVHQQRIRLISDELERVIVEAILIWPQIGKHNLEGIIAHLQCLYQILSRCLFIEFSFEVLLGLHGCVASLDLFPILWIDQFCKIKCLRVSSTTLTSAAVYFT